MRRELTGHRSLQAVGVERIDSPGRHPELESDGCDALNATLQNGTTIRKRMAPRSPSSALPTSGVGRGLLAAT